MPKVGEAYYEITARDQGLARALTGAEGQAKRSGAAIEGAVGDKTTAGFDKAGQSATRFGGVLGGVSTQGGKLSGIMSNLGGGVLQGVGIAGFMGVTAAAAGLVGMFGSAITAASDMSETVSKVGVVFGSEAENVRAWGSNAALAMGMSEQAALGAAATLGNLFVSLKLPQAEAANMSTSMVTLAGDLASFNNVDPTEALDALRAGLVGETEPLKRFGVNLNEATISQKALEMGLISTTKGTLPAAAKAQASYALIMEQTATAQGDFARTSTGYANQGRINAAQLQDSLARLGAALLPLGMMFQTLGATIASTVVGAFTFLAENARPIGVLLGVLAATVIPSLIGALGAWLAVQLPLAAAVIATHAPLILLATGVGIVVAVLEKLGLLGPILDAFFGALGMVGQAIGTVFGAVVEVVKGAVSAIIDGIWHVTNAAAGVPGPWQEAATQARSSLEQMKRDVQAWGTETVDTAGATGEAVPPAVADPLTAGAPLVAGASDTMASPIVDAMKTAKKDAVVEAKKTPGEIASGIESGRTSVGDAGQNLVDAMKNAIDPMDEIADLKGKLTSKTMRDGLASGNPEIRAAAEAWKVQVEDRLFALQNNTAGIALKTGRSYTDTLAAQKEHAKTSASYVAQYTQRPLDEEVGKAAAAGGLTGSKWAGGVEGAKSSARTAGANVAGAAKGGLQSLNGSAREWGVGLGSAYADGLRATYGIISEAAAGAVRGAVGPMRASSPPGPESPLHFIDVWGRRTFEAYADGIRGARSSIAQAAQEAVSGASPSLNVSASVSGALGPSVARVAVEHVIRDPDGALAKIGTSPEAVAGALVQGLDATGFSRNVTHLVTVR